MINMERSEDIRIAICDEESFCRDQVMTAAARYAAEYPEKNLVFTPFSYPDDLIEAAEKGGGYDIYILDMLCPAQTESLLV